MASDPKNESYFAPPSGGVPTPNPTEPAAWGEDAEAIARDAGLGSYQTTAIEQQAREDAIIRALEQTDRELRLLRKGVNYLWGAVVGLTVGLVSLWLGR